MPLPGTYQVSLQMGVSSSPSTPATHAPWRPSPAVVIYFSDVTAPLPGSCSMTIPMPSLRAGWTERGRAQAVPGTSLAPSVWGILHSPSMSPSAKKRPQNSVVFKVGLGTGPRGGLTKSPTTPRAGGGKGSAEGWREVRRVKMVSPFLPPNRSEITLGLGLVKSCWAKWRGLMEALRG